MGDLENLTRVHEVNEMLRARVESYRRLVRDMVRAAHLIDPEFGQAIDVTPLARATPDLHAPVAASIVAVAPVPEAPSPALDPFDVSGVEDPVTTSVVNTLLAAAPYAETSPCIPDVARAAVDNFSRLSQELAAHGVRMNLVDLAQAPEMLRLAARAWIDQGASLEAMPPALEAYRVPALAGERGPLPAHVVIDLGEHPSVTAADRRVRFVLRARAEGLVPSEGPVDDAWIALQYKAPPGWFTKAYVPPSEPVAAAPAVPATPAQPAAPLVETAAPVPPVHGGTVQAPKRRPGRPRKTPAASAPAAAAPPVVASTYDPAVASIPLPEHPIVPVNGVDHAKTLPVGVDPWDYASARADAVES
jgi:hypothetical protein